MNNKTIKWVLFVLLCIILITLAIVSFEYDRLSRDLLPKEDVDQFSFFHLPNDQITIFEDRLIKLNEEEISFFSINDEEEISKTKHIMNNVMMKIIDKKCWLYGMDSNSIDIYSLDGYLLDAIEIEGSIKKIIDIGDGHVGVIYKKTRYNSAIRIYDRSLNIFFERLFANSYVMDAFEINKKTLVMLFMDLSNLETQSFIEVYDYEKNAIKSKKALLEGIVFDIIPLNHQRYFYYHPYSAEILNVDYESIWKKEFIDGETLEMVANINKEMVYLISSGENINLYAINDEGICTFTANLEAMPNYFIAMEDGCLVSYQKNVVYYNLKGVALHTFETDDIIKGIFSNGNNVYIMTKEKILKRKVTNK